MLLKKIASYSSSLVAILSFKKLLGHATLQVAAILYIEALEMQLVSMCVCVLALCIWGGGGVTVVILSVHAIRGGGTYRLGAFEYTD